MEYYDELLDLAFGTLVIPAPEDLVKDKSGIDLESKEIVEKFGGRHWKDFSPDELALESDTLWFLSPVGFQFLLPTFLRVAVQSYESVDRVPDALVYACLPPERPEFSEAHYERLSVLTAPQRQALCEFLLHMKESHEEDFNPGDLERALANIQDRDEPQLSER